MGTGTRPPRPVHWLRPQCGTGAQPARAEGARAMVPCVGFGTDVGLFLCTDAGTEGIWPLTERERFLDDVNASLRRLALPEHREPRSLAEIDPPLGPETNPCLLGASMGTYS